MRSPRDEVKPERDDRVDRHELDALGPIGLPVATDRVEVCSVACTINAAIGTMACGAEKKITGGGR
jgi:hypothetical protein